MNLLSLLMQKLGYVRLKDYGYALTPEGRIVEVPRVVDDRFEPPPFQPVAWQSPVSLLPPTPRTPPVPRPLPPPPDSEDAVAANTRVETGPPGQKDSASPAVAQTAAAAGAEEVVDEEEWEWRMAMARARAQADRAAPPPTPPSRAADAAEARPRWTTQVAAVAPSRPTRPTAAMSAAAPPASRATPAPARPTASRPAARPSASMPIAAASKPAAGASKPAVAASKPLAAASRPTPARGTPAPNASGAVAATGKPGARRSAEVSAAAAREVIASKPEITSEPRAHAPRLARGTHGIERIVEPVRRPQLAHGSSPHSLPDIGDVTATDVTAVDRARAAMREDDDTRVGLAAVPADAGNATLDLSLEDEDRTSVEPATSLLAVVASSDAAPLPRLTARLRRTSPN